MMISVFTARPEGRGGLNFSEDFLELSSYLEISQKVEVGRLET